MKTIIRWNTWRIGQCLTPERSRKLQRRLHRSPAVRRAFAKPLGYVLTGNYRRDFAAR